MIDIFLPKTLHNVKEGEIWVKCFADSVYTFHVPTGYYPTVFSLVPTIHLLFRSVGLPHLAIAMNFDHNTSHAAFVISRGREIQMSPRLDNLLRFETVVCRGGANGTMALGIQGRGASKERNCKNLNVVAG